jgi:hypothetical protein
VYDNKQQALSTNGKFNTFTWSSSDANLHPLNIAGNLYGAGSGFIDDVSGSLSDPASFFVDSSICADSRLISACMRMTYTGALQNSSGQMGFIENLPLHSILEGGVGGVPCNVNELFQHAPHTCRLGIDTAEVIFAPDSRTAEIFTQESDGAMENTEPANPTTITQEADTLNPRVFGFVWRGLDMPIGEDAKLSFELIKNSEWRPEASSGLPEVTIKHMGPSKIQPALTGLDSKFPGWTRKVSMAAGSVASQISKAAFAGVTNYARDLALGALKGINPLLGAGVQGLLRG